MTGLSIELLPKYIKLLKTPFFSSVGLKCLPDPSVYAGWLSYYIGETDNPFMCADGYEWSDRTTQWKVILCDAATDGSRVFYFDTQNQIEVSCQGI